MADFLSQIEPSTKRKISGSFTKKLTGSKNRKLTGMDKPPSLRTLRAPLVPGTGVRGTFRPKSQVMRRKPRS